MRPWFWLLALTALIKSTGSLCIEIHNNVLHRLSPIQRSFGKNVIFWVSNGFKFCLRFSCHIHMELIHDDKIRIIGYTSSVGFNNSFKFPTLFFSISIFTYLLSIFCLVTWTISKVNSDLCKVVWHAIQNMYPLCKASHSKYCKKLKIPVSKTLVEKAGRCCI